ncbi:MAG TPA: hypothetical protein VFA33_06210 [Bryobacteraceae bacterium]|nr:hypothetical protein [Bryobacteraceae bacterium]
MAESPAHQFGQMIGDVLEAAIEPILQSFATKYGLYLDKKGLRPARPGNKVSWTDGKENKHDLDFVLERGGTAAKKGIPVAFIETAWRRYTKHSRNKAQEIQGAIIPLIEKHKNHCPFIGVVLAGVFTDGALSQLRSLGFTVAYFPYTTIIKAFSVVGIDASSDEQTPDDEFAEKMRRWNALKPADKAKLYKTLIDLNEGEMKLFFGNLVKMVNRQIKSVRILPLHGAPVEWANIEDAIKFIADYREESTDKALLRYEVQIVYVNGDRISGEFGAKQDAIDFLKTYQTACKTDSEAVGGKS